LLDEETASALLVQANAANERQDYSEAVRLLTQLTDRHSATRAARTGSKLLSELDVIGKTAVPIEVETWFQGEARTDATVQLLVFWEVWCPHCKREVPKLETLYTTYGSRGLDVIGLTKQSRDTSDSQVQSFIEDVTITYPVAREAGGRLSAAYGVKGVPAAAVIKDGKVIWRGHPGRLNDTMIEGWL
jgi:peroxiredoxin